MQSYVVKTRRKLHQIPEIGFELDKTLELIKSELSSMGVPYCEDFGKSSLVATLGGGGRTVGIRADIDALPIGEESGEEFSSLNAGKMHACGHDAHVAMALDAIRRLKDIEDTLPCRVRVIFQAAEEYSTSGAKLMAEDGVMDGIDEIIAIHVDPSYDSGTVALSFGAQNAVSCGFKLKFYGKSAHVAVLDTGVDAIKMAMSAYGDIQLALKRQLPEGERVIFNAGAIHGGVTNNVVCEECELFCTVRAQSDEICDTVVGIIKQVISDTANAFGGKSEYIPVKYYPVVYNDKRITEKAKTALKKRLADDKIKSKKRDMIGEDFAYFANLKPACMIRLGVKNEALGISAPLHSPKFRIDELALEIGSDFFFDYVINSN